MQMRLLSYMPKTSINLSLYCITGAVTKCDNDSLGLKLVYSWIYIHFKSINLSLYCITGAVTKCDNDSLGLKLVYSWIYIHFKSLLMFSLKFMNMQVS